MSVGVAAVAVVVVIVWCAEEVSQWLLQGCGVSWQAQCVQGPRGMYCQQTGMYCQVIDCSANRFVGLDHDDLQSLPLALQAVNA